jgi:hypothetical protein
MTNRRDLTRRGAKAFGQIRSVLDRHAATISKMNEQLSAAAVALAIILTLTAACRAPSYWADHSTAEHTQE